MDARPWGGVPAKELKDRMLWSAGWKQKEELDWSGDPNSLEVGVLATSSTA